MTNKSFAYLVPQFPGQTHIFFWREIAALEAQGVTPVLYSTTVPPSGLISHRWSQEAMARTTYLASRNPALLMAILPRLPWGLILKEARRLPKDEAKTFLKDVIISSPAAEKLARDCKRRGITHIHAHSCGRAALIAALAHHAHGLSYSLTLHGPLQDYGVGQRFKWRGTAFVSVITRALLDLLPGQLGDALPKRLPLQPMGVDTSAFRRDAPYVPPVPGEPLRVFSCGRLNVVKGHQDLMQAVRLMIDRGQPVHLEIAGEDDAGGGGFHKELDTRIVELGLEDHVTLLGAISAEAVRDKLMSSHVFVLASWSEPLGVAYMEAMSCEVPTIGTDAGGVPELITSGEDGILVPPKNPEALAEVLMQLAADPEKAQLLAKTGRARVVADFDSSRGADMLVREIWNA
ncbi:exopolysaccharide biosynthesis GT4 family glycosyltransferase EpsE [Marivita sp.]|uniref:exopolysaccharide biosynthesis GT4 family glycosyltransferase EpsE n=1 Tax=Marivita sp. TaxID=2003365 RepID=UPI00261B5C23|nr:exopolysaccharide biosynthesis GT4 family glycosyltransferase EpsE [Marivita sp.]